MILSVRGRHAFLVLCALSTASSSQSFKILIPSPSGTDCAGCTNGGPACFGFNACDAGCLTQISFSCDTCQQTEDKACCPSCSDSRCTPNIPCAGRTPYTVLADTCPTIGSAQGPCQYYARKSKCLNGHCKYYAIEAPTRCLSPPATTVDLNAEQLSCIRQCLQASDAILDSGCSTADGCTRVSCIVNYHQQCFTTCGVSPLRFPARLFRWFGEHDGD